MVQSQFSLSWDSYKSSICDGFSVLQQNGEFVDMTIASDGHFVKVHQVLLALASPYLKELIASAPCQHPILFLNNISHEILCFLLEYIYTGEVLVPSEDLSQFIDAAKALRIKGLHNLITDNFQTNSDIPEQFTLPHQKSGKRAQSVNATKRKTTIEVEIPRQAQKIQIKQEDSTSSSVKLNTLKSLCEDVDYDYEMLDDTDIREDDDYSPKEELCEKTKPKEKQLKEECSNLQYTVSIRGCLQIILNRYIYNLNSTMTKSGLRRWRCVQYRDHKCRAFVVTNGNVVVNRINPHNHGFHDKKILAKIEKKAVFSAMGEVEEYQESVKLNSERYYDSETALEQEPVLYEEIQEEDNIETIL